jgi:hypothetical protein
MIRRTIVIALFVIATLAAAAAPAFAYAPYRSYAVGSAARLVPGATGAVWMWSDPGAAGADLLASRVDSATGEVSGPFTVVSGVAGLGAWQAGADGRTVTVAWKDGASVYVLSYDLSRGAKVFGPVRVTGDAQAVAMRGAGATATPAGVTPDGEGGAYVWCSVSPKDPAGVGGDTLLNHVSADGKAATTIASKQHVAGGTVAALAATTDGDAFALLGGPGRSRVAVELVHPDLSVAWTRSPYLIEPQQVASSTPVGMYAGTVATVAWREGSQVKVQRVDAEGTRMFLTPPALSMAGTVALASDGSAGAYVVGPSGLGIVARHVLSSGREAPWDPAPLGSLGLTKPRVDAVTSNGAGDLFAAYSNADAPSAASSGIAVMTFTGMWSDATPPTGRSARYTGAVADGAGGAYVIGSGQDAMLWRLSFAAATLTVRPQAKVVQYGSTVDIRGYMTAAGGVPVSGGSVKVGTIKAGVLTPAATVQTGASGLYSATVKPVANATWSATGVAAGDQVLVQVAPRVDLKLSHIKSGKRLTETFTGKVAPRHAGTRVLVQRAVGGVWKTVARGRLDSRSRYRITWRLPYKTAKYKLRTMLPAHADHVEGVSLTAVLKVKIIVRK